MGFKRNPILSAVKAGDVAKMEKLTKKPHFVKDCAKEFDKSTGLTPLTQAALLGTAKILELMIDAEADPNIKDKNNNTPLFTATFHDQGLVAKALSKYKKLDFDAVCSGDLTATDLAKKNGNNDILKYIGDAVGLRLVEAGKAGALDDVKLLVKRPMINLEASDTTGWTALHFAMQQNFEEMVEVLASAGADGKYKNMAGDTPIDIALKKGNKAIVKLYDDTVKGCGRLEMKERDREREPEKQIGVLKEEGVAETEFKRKIFSEDEIVKMQMQLALEQIEDTGKDNKPVKDKLHRIISPRKEKQKKEKITSPRKDKTPKKEKVTSPRKDKTPRKEKSHKKEKITQETEKPDKLEIEVKGGWKHLTESEKE